MEILLKAIRIIDYENNKIYNRITPPKFTEYLNDLINYVNSNSSVRLYKTRSNSTEVISNILTIIKDSSDENTVMNSVEIIAKRLLSKEVEAQDKISHLPTDVQKGSLIQALIYSEISESYYYLLAKIQHTEFVEDDDFEFKTGFPKDKVKLWKSCIFKLDDLDSDIFEVKVYSDKPIKYWYDDFLELDVKTTDEVNTEKSLKSIESTLNRLVKNQSPRDHAVLRTGIISYLKSHRYIDYDIMIETCVKNYTPVDLKIENFESLVEKLKKLPDNNQFDRQFNCVSAIVDKKIKKVYEVYDGIKLTISKNIDNIDNIITSHSSEDGNNYIQIKVTNPDTFRRFLQSPTK